MMTQVMEYNNTDEGRRDKDGDNERRGGGGRERMGGDREAMAEGGREKVGKERVEGEKRGGRGREYGDRSRGERKKEEKREREIEKIAREIEKIQERRERGEESVKRSLLTKIGNFGRSSPSLSPLPHRKSTPDASSPSSSPLLHRKSIPDPSTSSLSPLGQRKTIVELSSPCISPLTHRKTIPESCHLSLSPLGHRKSIPDPSSPLAHRKSIPHHENSKNRSSSPFHSPLSHRKAFPNLPSPCSSPLAHRKSIHTIIKSPVCLMVLAIQPNYHEKLLKRSNSLKKLLKLPIFGIQQVSGMTTMHSPWTIQSSGSFTTFYAAMCLGFRVEQQQQDCDSSTLFWVEMEDIVLLVVASQGEYETPWRRTQKIT
ncbi:hypothetical protein Pmani_040012 [Petrolisthes manimaculis]|uniref:Uncharacterized protein n=1 Tax=Petrolisthes manimaculis TaxID=1843537 RepID=A0AAE1NCS3_9EUCA|nr:hypothetical protein Pmani_040012 [Petrolisthes manimaculis]